MYRKTAPRVLHKKAVQQSTPKDDHYRTAQGEQYLYRLLDKMCLTVGLQLAEWDVDEGRSLMEAIVDNCNADSKKALKSYEIYDECFHLLKAVGISVNSKYDWFTHLKQIVTNKQ
jgi:hypothetical protein